jgi:hypothetical protein
MRTKDTDLRVDKKVEKIEHELGKHELAVPHVFCQKIATCIKSFKRVFLEANNAKI